MNDTSTRIRVAATAVMVALLISSVSSPAQAEDGHRADPVGTWLRHRAVPIRLGKAAGQRPFEHALEAASKGARIVGLGEAVHGAREIAALKLRVVKVLVTRMGFRSIAWEEDWTTGHAIDRYLRTGQGDLRALVNRMTGQWRSRDTMRVLEWLRSYNVLHNEVVRFTGVEYYYTGRWAYDAVAAYARRATPQSLPQILADLEFLRPTMKKEAYAAWYAALPDKQTYVDHARRLFQAVSQISHGAQDRPHALAVHNAAQILWFYEHYDRSPAAQARFREPRSAHNLSWWQHRTRDRVIYWAATPHTAAAPQLRISIPGPDFRFASAGSFLRSWYGRAYVSLGFTFDHGAVGLPPDEVVSMSPPRPEWFESKLSLVRLQAFMVDLRMDRYLDPAVRQWLSEPLKTRGLPQAGPTSFIAGGSVTQWFDSLVHVQVVHPQRPVGPGRRPAG
jgi:erythromycin esterase-like protein